MSVCVHVVVIILFIAVVGIVFVAVVVVACCLFSFCAGLSLLITMTAVPQSAWPKLSIFHSILLCAHT